MALSINHHRRHCSLVFPSSNCVIAFPLFLSCLCLCLLTPCLPSPSSIPHPCRRLPAIAKSSSTTHRHLILFCVCVCSPLVHPPPSPPSSRYRQIFHHHRHLFASPALAAIFLLLPNLPPPSPSLRVPCPCRRLPVIAKSSTTVAISSSHRFLPQC